MGVFWQHWSSCDVASALDGKRPARRMKVSRENYVRGARMRKIWGEEALEFQEKLLNSSGLGDETYFPDSACACAGGRHAFALTLQEHVGGVLQRL